MARGPASATRQPGPPSAEFAALALRDYSQLAGPITEPPADRPYKVQFRRLAASAGRAAHLRSLLVILCNIAVELLFVWWLLSPAHVPEPDVYRPLASAANVFVIVSIAIVELFRLINVVSLSLATVRARDPIPVRPAGDLRVAFLTTIVPSKEPLAMVRATLAAARRIGYARGIDVWLLDEGNDPAVARMCRQIGVYHFSRKDRPEYNREQGAFKAKTKHGNYNSWLDSHGHQYDVLLSVDPDHAPLPNYAERMLGYFRDPNVAYVVGPQCYANYETFVTKAAESQQFPFHSVIQRAANAYGVPMLVGTNNAIRISALASIGGLQDSITEDMATGLALHTRRNPETGAKWRSVYTPDVVAVGEGPSSWGDYFSQQLRWSRGTFEILSGDFWRRIPFLSPGRLWHYLLITAFYPSMALGWILGSINAVLYLALGVQGIEVPPQLWLALYVDATAFQMWVYIRNRRYNVSPYEKDGSPGIKGMLMSVLASPIYASSLISTLLRRPARFVVTPKNSASSADRLITFRRHLQWAVLLSGAVVASFVLGYASVEVLFWPALSVIVCLVPVVAMYTRKVKLWRAARRSVPAAPLPPAADLTERIPVGATAGLR